MRLMLVQGTGKEFSAERRYLYQIERVTHQEPIDDHAMH